MSDRLMKKIAHLLIISSFILFSLASFISIKESKLDGTKKVESSEVSITEKPDVDEESIIEANDDSKTTSNTGSNNSSTGASSNTPTNNNPVTNNTGNKPSNSSGTGTNQPSNNQPASTPANNTGSGGSNNNNNNNTGNNNTTPPSNPSTPTTSYVDNNNNLRVSIENQYNVNIVYGKETSGYTVGGMTTTIINDSASITRALNSLKSCLSRYPSNFFNEIHSSYPLTIYLINKYSINNVTGVTDSTNRTVVISIATAYPFDVSFHHELYHYIEHYLFSKGASFNTWNSLNPTGFTYGNINKNLSYANTLSPDSYFVNEYAMYSDAEDRASTFEFMTAGSKASCLNSGKPVYLKARYMAQTMEYYMNSVSPSVTEYWERFL